MQWQPIETAPKGGIDWVLLGYYPPHMDGKQLGGKPRIAFWNGDRWVESGGAILRVSGPFSPTHWMPLPAPPDTQRTDPPNCDWHRDEFGNWFSGCSETMPDFTPWKGTDPNGAHCPKCGKVIATKVHDKP